MPCDIEQIDSRSYDEYAAISNGFLVGSVLAVDATAAERPADELVAYPLSLPYWKFYPTEHPAIWAARFDVERWGMFVAREDGSTAGGAAVARPGPFVTLTQGLDNAVLWDLRVHPLHRRRGVGSALVRRAVAWAREAGFAALAVETQDVNVPACRLYASCGFRLAEVREHAYAELPDVAHEKMLVWHLAL